MVVALDATDLCALGKGVSRALQNVVPRLVLAPGNARYMVLTTREGKGLLPDVAPRSLCVVPEMPGSVWEQVGLAWYARRVGADLVYSPSECGPRWGPPYVLHVFEDPMFRWARAPRHPRDRIRMRYEQLAVGPSLRRARRLVTSTAATKARLVERLRLPPDRIDVIPLGIDLRFFSGPAAGPAEPYLFHLGSADPRDNTVAVIRAQGILNNRCDAPPLVVAGELGDLTVPAQRAIDQAGCAGSVRLLGRVSDADLVRLYAGATICLQPSSDEGFGLQPLEALAARAPLVAVDTPAVRETVGNAALFVASPEPKLIAEAAGRILSDKSLSAELRDRGRRRALEFTWERTTQRVQELLTRVLLEEP